MERYITWKLVLSLAILLPTQALAADKLPISDSFANATISEYFTTDKVQGNVFNWRAVSEANYPLSTPYDNDGGMLYFYSYDSPVGTSARLMSREIDASSASNPVLDFFLCHAQGDFKDQVVVEISKNGGEWADAETDTYHYVGGGSAPDGTWERVRVYLKDAIGSDCTTFRVALKAVSNYGRNIIIDALRIYNVADNDLDLVSISAPKSVVSGNDCFITMEVANNGNTEVKASDYSIDFTSTFTGTIPNVTTADIPAMENAKLEVRIPVTAIEAVKESFTLQAKTVCTSDPEESNNTSRTVNVNMQFSSEPGATNFIRGWDADDNHLMLNWDAAKDTKEDLFSINESFEMFDMSSTGPFNGFVVIDRDKSASEEAIYSASGSIFNVTTPSAGTPADGNGYKMLGVTCGATVQQNDWLISPALACAHNFEMSISFLIAFKAQSGIDNKVEVLYATEDYNAADPAAAFTKKAKSFIGSTDAGAYVNADGKFHLVEINDIPAEAKYIAIHIYTQTTLSSLEPATWIDNITIKEVNDAPLRGYRIYDLESGLVDTGGLISATATSYTMPFIEAVCRYEIVAVYDDGEATPSNVISVDPGPSAVESVETSASNIIVCLDGITIANCEGQPIAVYDIAGRCITSATATSSIHFISLPAGTYVVKVGTNASIVSLR